MMKIVMIFSRDDLKWHTISDRGQIV